MLVTPQTIADATGIPLSDSGQPDGAAEKAAGAAFVMRANAALRRDLGEARYAEIAAWEGQGGVNGEAFLKLSHAASLLAFAAALPTLNLRATEEGGFIRTTGFDASREELLSPVQIAALQAELRGQAALLIGDLPTPPPLPRRQRMPGTGVVCAGANWDPC